MNQVLYILEAVEGGAWRHLANLIKGIHGKFVECSVVLSFERKLGNDSEVRAFLTSLNVPVYEFPMKRGVAPGDMSAVLKLTRLIRQIKPDLIHAHCAKAGVLGRVSAKLAGVPSVYTPHCFPFFMNNTGLSSAYSFIERGMISITSELIVLSREEHDAAIELGYPHRRVQLIPNGIESCNLPLPEINEHEPLQLGFFGRTGGQKGADEFVKLVEELNERGVDCLGVVYGIRDVTRLSRSFASPLKEQPYGDIREGEAPAEPKIDWKSNIRCYGQCPQDQVVEAMRALDVIVMPSRWEGLPYVLLEALDAGVPVCAYNVGGIGDVVQHGVSAMLAEPGKYEELVENCIALKDTGLRRKIAERGREAVAPYTLKRMIEATLDVYKIVFQTGLQD